MMSAKRTGALLLAAILLWAGFLRLYRCDVSPPGIQSDEAANAFNAWCLLKTGQDEWGQRWPVFYTRCFDDFRSPLYLYLLMPFQAIGGMNVCTTRLPAAIGGGLTVLLVYYVGRRMFDVPTGLVAATLLAVMPWHIQHTRWGHEGALMPLLVAGSIAAMFWAGAPIVDEAPRARPWRGALAGVTVGVCFCGYAAVRLYLPVMLLVTALVPAGSWKVSFRDRATRRSAVLFALALLFTLAPLGWKHLADPSINRRADELKPWSPSDSIARRSLNILARWPAHFSPAFLFTSGSPSPALAPPSGYGCLQWYMLPAIAAGVVVLAAKVRRSRSARLLLALLLTYPAGDMLFGYLREPHALRSFPGALWISLTAAAGTIFSLRWLARKHAAFAAAVTVALLLWASVSHLSFLRTFFGSYNDEPNTAWVRNVDLMHACDWLRPRLPQLDAVYCTDQGLTYPYAPMAVLLNLEPRDWFESKRDYAPGPPPFESKRVCIGFGKVYILSDMSSARRELAELAANGRRDRVAMILRPDEAALAGTHVPAREIRIAGSVWLLLYEFDL